MMYDTLPFIKVVCFFFKQIVGDDVMEFSKNSIEICGKKYKFKRCTNAQILEHQKSIEAEQEKYKPITDEAKQIERDVEAIDTEIEAINNIVVAINKKEEPTDKDLDNVTKYSMQLVDLSNQRRKLVEKGEALDEKHKKEIEAIRKYVLEKYGELAELQLDGITKEEFVKNADDSDMTIIRLLASIKKMLSLGASPKDVEKFVKQNIIAEAKQSFQSD